MNKAFLIDCEAHPPFTIKLTDEDIPHIKRVLQHNGGIYVNRKVARTLKQKGFEEGVHYHVQKPLPTGKTNGKRKLRRAR